MKPSLFVCFLCFAACDDSAVVVSNDGAASDAALGDSAKGGGTLADAQGRDTAGSDSLGAGDTAPDVMGASACNPRVSQHADQGGIHIGESSFNPATYNSNPPSSGPHCGVWGAYTTYDATPLPRCNYIHNLEHGAVVLLHNCPSGCADVKTAFAAIVQSFKGERDCPNKRFVITPDSALATKVAAAAWGWTFTADCLDAAALTVLTKFVDDHYGHSPEVVCGDGFSP